MSDQGRFSTDSIGMLSAVSDEGIAAASKLVRRGARFRLDLPLDQPSPPLFGRPPFRHDVWQVEGFERASDDVLNDFNTQGSTHWDALRHVRGDDGYFEAKDPAELGVEHYATGVVGRTVLLDLTRSPGVEPEGRRPVSPDELDACAKEQGVEIEARDIILLRTGWLAPFLATAADERPELPEFAGLESSDAMYEWLEGHQITAIAADQLTVEVFPTEPDNVLHERIIPGLGIVIGELFWLEDLAADSVETGVWDGFMVSVPMRIPGGCASPANAVVFR
jgi:kynurenine formamidase